MRLFYKSTLMLFILIILLCPQGFAEGHKPLSPLDIEFKRKAVRRLVFDKDNAIALAGLNPAEVVDLSLGYPTINVSGGPTVGAAENGLLTLKAKGASESALWIGGFNPFATYDVSFVSSHGDGVEAGIEFATPGNQHRLNVTAVFSDNVCKQIRYSIVVDNESKQSETVDLEHPVKGPFVFRVQMMGTGLNVYVVENNVSRVVDTRDFSKTIDLRRIQHIRSFEFRLLTRLNKDQSVVIKKVQAALTTGAGQADIRAITGKDGAPLLDQGRLWFTMTVRGRHLPHPSQGVFSLNPSVFDIRLEGIVVFDRGDGLLRNEVASHLFYDEDEKMWRGITVGFSAYGDPDSAVPKQLWAVTSKRDPRFGFSIMKAKPLVVPNSGEDPHIIYDAQVGKWRVLACSKDSQVGWPATLYEADEWDGDYKIIAGPAKVNGTGPQLQKIGSQYYAIFGSADHQFYVYSYPDLKPLGNLNMFRPPWDENDVKSNSRCWPNVIPLPEGYPAPYIMLSMDRANYPGLKGWTYGSLYLYHGYPTSQERAAYEYDER